LRNKCRGIDHTRIEDDGGGLPKTVSVENSFRRNTVKSKDAVWKALCDLVWRLPRLLDDRRNNSDSPERAYPTTIRLTAAVVDRRLVHTKKRPFVTRSKQCSFAAGGKALMTETDDTKKSEIVQKAVTPLVNSLVLNDEDINVVRLNIAITGFQDLVVAVESPAAASPWAAFATKGATNERATRKRQRIHVAAAKEYVRKPTSMAKAPLSHEKAFGGSANAFSQTDIVAPLSFKVDPSVLAELPADIRAEVCRTYSTKDTSKKTIDQFFVKK